MSFSFFWMFLKNLLFLFLRETVVVILSLNIISYFHSFFLHLSYSCTFHTNIVPCSVSTECSGDRTGIQVATSNVRWWSFAVEWLYRECSIRLLLVCTTIANYFVIDWNSNGVMCSDFHIETLMRETKALGTYFLLG